MLAGGRDPPVCWCPQRCGAPLWAPRGVVCPPVVDACPVCCPPLRWALAPCAGPPPRCCGPDRDHCYDRLEATAPHRIHSLAPWRHQGSGHPHAYRSCVMRAGTVHAVIHSPQQAFSQQTREQWCSSQSQPQPQLRYQLPTPSLFGGELELGRVAQLRATSVGAVRLKPFTSPTLLFVQRLRGYPPSSCHVAGILVYGIRYSRVRSRLLFVIRKGKGMPPRTECVGVARWWRLQVPAGLYHV